jgi:hypothetical protein
MSNYKVIWDKPGRSSRPARFIIALVLDFRNNSKCELPIFIENFYRL